MLRQNRTPSKKALELVKKLIRKGVFRGDIFKQVDIAFNYPEHTTAKYFGKIESTISKKKMVYGKGLSHLADKKPKIRGDRRRGKVFSEEELKKAWWNKKPTKG